MLDLNFKDGDVLYADDLNAIVDEVNNKYNTSDAQVLDGKVTKLESETNTKFTELELKLDKQYIINEHLSSDKLFPLFISKGAVIVRRESDSNGICWVQFHNTPDASGSEFAFVQLPAGISEKEIVLDEDAKSIKVTIAEIAQDVHLSIEKKDSIINNLSEVEKQVIYDVTANNDGVTFASLSALLSSENLSTLIPVDVRCGGMSIRFIQTSDNKYVQYRLRSQLFTDDITQWQGIDNKPIMVSKNLVESGGVADGIAQLGFELTKKDSLQQRYINGLILISSHAPHDEQTFNRYSYFVPIKSGETLIANVACDNNHYAISFYSDKSFDSFVEGVAGTNHSKIEEYIYTASNDGYAVVCCTEYFIEDYTFTGTDYYIQNTGEEYFVKPILIRENIKNKK